VVDWLERVRRVVGLLWLVPKNDFW